MSKWLIKDKEDFESLKKRYNTNQTQWLGCGEPEDYPCIIATFRENNDNGKDYMNCEFIYLIDFEVAPI